MTSVVSFFAGPLLAGASFDLRDSYGPAYIAVAAMFVVSVALLSRVGRPQLEAGRPA
jgi:hypothetical protein